METPFDQQKPEESTVEKNPKPKKKKKPKPDPPPKPSGYPFRILGVTDNGTCFFIGRHDRMIESVLSSITKNILLQLADFDWWKENFGIEGRLNWDYPTDYIIEVSSAVDFDPEKIRGRGAWIDNESICYHDGKKTTGYPSKEKIYLRKSEKNIGISAQLPQNGLAKNMYYAVERMSFESEIDAVRLMGWTLLAPFCGALPWRPAILLTGASGSGKSTVIDRVVKPLAVPEIFSGGTTSEAGVRQRIKNDAAAVVIEESETDTRKKKGYRQDLFSLMRQSTSNDAPRAAKGTRDGRGQSFVLRSMFLFAAISPEVESEADDNRIFLVNMKKTDGSGWLDIEKKLDSYITPRNCASMRANTWVNLDGIIKNSKRLAPMIQKITRRDRRNCIADGLLFSAFVNSVMPIDGNTDEQVYHLLEHYYGLESRDPRRDETKEIVERLLDERFLVEKPDRRFLSLRQVLMAGYMGKITNQGETGDTLIESPYERSYFKSLANSVGVGLDEKKDLLIATNHHEVQKIIDKGRGYQRQLYRHDGLIERNRAVHMSGKTRRCIVLTGVMEVENE